MRLSSKVVFDKREMEKDLWGFVSLSLDKKDWERPW